MTRRLLVVLLPVILLISTAPLTVAGRLAPLVGQDETGAIADEYIVVLEEVTPEAGVGSAAKLARSSGGAIKFTYSDALSGFSAKLPAAAIQALRRNPSVAWIEADQRVHLTDTQANAPWGLDRIDQRNLPLNGSFVYNATGSGVNAYIIDTGIRLSHSQFGGRAISGYDAVDGGSADDCHGHGTHVAGTVGGSTYGVAKSVTLVSVRVLDCEGLGTASTVIAGVDWVTSNHSAGQPAVANMSVGGSPSTALDTAVNNSIGDGVTYAIAAMNESDDACYYSPARVAAAITVGATTSDDWRASYSNYGTCLDIFAPGSSITSAWYTSNTATATLNGTSMATPHVAGVAALYLQSNPTATAATVRNAIVTSASTGVVIDAGSGSPNRLLYSPLGGSPPPPTGPANDNFGSAQLISGPSGTIAGSNMDATGESGEPLNHTSSSEPIHSVWWSWTAPATGHVTIDTCGSTFDTTLGVYVGSTVDSLTEVASNDDDPDGICGLESWLDFTATAGETYRISVDGYADVTGDIGLAWALSGTDLTPPVVDNPTGLIIAPQTLGTMLNVRLSWPTASDPSGITGYELHIKKGTGAWTNVPLTNPTATSIDRALTPGATYRFRVRATDGVGNVSAWAATSSAKLKVVQETSTKAAYAGTWRRAALTGSLGGYVKYASVAGTRALFTFNGTNAVLVATTGPARGIADIYIDGVKVGTVDFYSSTVRKKHIAWALGTRLSPTNHTLEVRVTGQRNGASSGARVDVDAFISWP